MTSKKIFDDLAELAGGAVGLLSGLKEQLRDEARANVDLFTRQLDLPTRDEMDRLDGMIAKARIAQEEILKRLEKIERVLMIDTPKTKEPAPKTTTKKPASKKASVKKPAAKKFTQKKKSK